MKKINVRVISKMEQVDRWLTDLGIAHQYHKNRNIDNEYVGESIVILDANGKRRYHITKFNNFCNANNVVMMRRGARVTVESILLDTVTIEEFKEKIQKYFCKVNWPV